MGLLESIIINYPDMMFMLAEGFDDALLGIEEKTMVLVYSKDKCLDILSKDMEYIEALEYLEEEINVRYRIVGSPLFINDNF
jgi:hypothetical protein